MARRNQKNRFLKGFHLDDSYLVPPDPDRGQPGMLRGRDPEGRDAIIKIWPRVRGSSDEDLAQIWRSEIRQLQRLAAVPRADELFVPMLASGKDDEGFYVVLDPGQGSPLEIFRRSKNPPPTLAQSRDPRNRRRLWANVLRVAEALELLHSQGVIHRNLDPWAIITSFDEQPDFRLTGFEWSMRIAGTEGRTAARPVGEDNTASFGRDWSNLSLLAAELIAAPLDRVANLRLAPSEIAEHISAGEGQILRSMMGLQPSERLDGELICRRIGDVVAAIAAQAAGREASHALALRLGTGSRLAETIRRASGNEIETSDIAAQVEFVAGDLSIEPYFARLRDQDGGEPRFGLFGQLLTYVLSPYRRPDSTEAADWEFAFSDRATEGRPPPGAIVSAVRMDPEGLEPLTTIAASRSFPRRRGRVARWDELIRATEPKEVRKTDLDRMHEAFSLLLVLEMAYAAADIFPVEALPGAADRVGDAYQLRVAARLDPDRAELSSALALEAPAVRLGKMLESEDYREEGAWTLSDTGALGDRPQETEWRFVRRSEESAREILRFEGSAPSQLRGPAFLAPPGMVGQIAQFRRRRKALRVLREHTELLQMLVDPRLRIEDSHDPLDEGDSRFRALDSSKQAALREILSTIPLFLLQGPPGVGKTYLAGEIVRRRFEDDPTTRMLLSAQSNAAIDHLMKEVQSVFADSADAPPVMVRARPADDDPADTDLEIDRQADRHLQALAESDLVDEAAPELRDKIRALAEARREQKAGRRSARASRMSAEGKAFEGMILRAANLVFATTNSAAVERLIEERGLFDWTLLEEAGKATGGELLSPLLLSHRRLMIGDHKQLPPYGLDKMSRLLSEPEKVRAAIARAQDLISRYLKDPGTDELFDDIEEEDFGRLCSDTLSVLVLFETLVEREFSRKPRFGPLRPIAAAG